MIDGAGRTVNNLRISVTQRCNLSCDYCHREGESDPKEEMSVQTIKEIISSAVKAGITKIKITGGEPLLRTDITDIVRVIREHPQISDISMTTNGHFLPRYAQELKEAGLDRINIGCDSLTSTIVKGSQNITRALEAIKQAGYENTKLNMVVLKGINEHEVWNMAEFARKNNCTLQLIELINTDPDYYKQHHYPLSLIEEEIKKKAVSATSREMHARKIYDLGDVKIELVAPFHGDFCKQCTRLRVTSDGQLKPCLMREDNHVPYAGDESFAQANERRKVYR